MTYELTASYSAISRWELDFNLHTVFDWYIRWDTLYVKFKEIDEEYVRNNWIVDGEFNRKILDRSSIVTGQVRLGKNEDQRYVYFPIEDFVWDGQSNILIIYYMDGQTEKGGWNGAPKDVAWLTVGGAVCVGGCWKLFSGNMRPGTWLATEIAPV